MARIYKCYYCKEPIKNDLVEFQIGQQIKRSHKQCREEVLERKNIVKCQLCGESIHIDNVYTQQYVNKLGNFATKEGHEKCVKSWHKDYTEYNELNELLLDTLNLPELSKNFIQRIRQLRQKYDYSIIYKTVEEKEKAIQDYFPTHGWNYIFGIINNSIGQIYSKNKKKEEQIILEEKQQNITVIDMSKSKKFDTTDYSTLLD